MVATEGQDVYVMCSCPSCQYRLRCTVLVLCGSLTWRLLEGETMEALVVVEKTAQLAAQWAALEGERLVVS